MNIKNLTAPCGVDCFNCGAYEGNINDALRKLISEISGKDPSKVHCGGCRNMNGSGLPMAEKCATFECIHNNNVDFCYECSNFPCNKYSPCLDKANFTPHNLKIYNLCRIKNIGLDRWASEAKSIREKYYRGKFIPGDEPTI